MFLFKINHCMHSLWPLSQWWWSGLSPAASQEPRPRHWHVFAASLWLSILTGLCVPLLERSMCPFCALCWSALIQWSKMSLKSSICPLPGPSVDSIAFQKRNKNVESVESQWIKQDVMTLGLQHRHLVVLVARDWAWLALTSLICMTRSQLQGVGILRPLLDWKLCDLQRCRSPPLRVAILLTTT